MYIIFFELQLKFSFIMKVFFRVFESIWLSFYYYIANTTSFISAFIDPINVLFPEYIYIYIYIYIFVCRKTDNNVIQVEREIYWEVNTIAFLFYWTIIRTMRGDISNVKSTMDV